LEIVLGFGIAWCVLALWGCIGPADSLRYIVLGRVGRSWLVDPVGQREAR